MKTRRLLLVAVSLTPLVAAFVSCAADEDLNPLSGAASSSMASSSSAMERDAGSDADASIGDAGPPKRTVIQRDPFGDVAESKNLLWDGDFEWTSAFSDESGWYYGTSFSNLAPVPPTTIGAICRSGIKCGLLPKNGLLIGLAVASETKPIRASVWVKPKKGGCAKAAQVYVANDGAGSDPEVVLAPKSDAPDADGWCQFEGVTDVRTEKPYLYIDNKSGDDLVVDDCVVAVSDDPKPHGLVMHPFTAEELEELAAMKREVRKKRVPRDPPPNEARRAFERSKRR